MRLKLILFALILFACFVFADGMMFRPDYRLASVSETDQIAIITVDDTGYTLDLFVKVDSPNVGERVSFWAVPLEELPDKVELNSFADSNFEEKLKSFNKGYDEAKRLTNAKRNFDQSFTIGSALLSPALPLVILAMTTVVYTVQGANAKADSSIVQSYDFGEMGTLDIYDTNYEPSLRGLYQRIGVSPDANLEPYFDKKLALFKLDKIDDFGLVATFHFKDNNRIYFPSGTTQYFDPKPERFGVFIRAPREFVFTEKSGFSRASMSSGVSYDLQVGTKEQFISIGPDKYVEWRGGGSALYSKDVILEKTGFRGGPTLKETLVSIVDPFLLGLISSIALILIAMIVVLGSKIKDLIAVGKFIGVYIVSLLFIIFGLAFASAILMLLGSVLQYLSYPHTNLIAPVIFFVVTLIPTGVLFFILLKANGLFNDFSRKKMAAVIFVISIAILILNILIYSLQ